MNTITHRPLHFPLFCVYDRDGDLLGAFPTMEAAEAFSAYQMYGPEL